MPTYKLKPGFNHYGYRDSKDSDGNPIIVNGVTQRERYKLKVGETEVMSEERFIEANLKDRFVLVSGSSEAGSSESDEPSSTDWSFIKKKNQTEVLDLISNVQDKETASKIYEAEESGKNREKVLEAARLKYIELGGSTE